MLIKEKNLSFNKAIKLRFKVRIYRIYESFKKFIQKLEIKTHQGCD